MQQQLAPFYFPFKLWENHSSFLCVVAAAVAFEHNSAKLADFIVIRIIYEHLSSFGEG
jgi:hypothetical protein